MCTSESDNSPASSGDRYIQYTFSERSLYVLTYNQIKTSAKDDREKSFDRSSSQCRNAGAINSFPTRLGENRRVTVQGKRAEDITQRLIFVFTESLI